jgi:hypothetical protein
MKYIYLTLAVFLLSSTAYPYIKERNVLDIWVKSDSTIIVKGKIMPLNKIKDFVKEYVSNPNHDMNMCEFMIKKIPFLGDTEVPKIIISIQTDNSTTYGLYISVNNEIEKAYNELWNELSIKAFKKPFINLPKEKANAIKKAIPKRIYEAEPIRKDKT